MKKLVLLGLLISLPTVSLATVTHTLPPDHGTGRTQVIETDAPQPAPKKVQTPTRKVVKQQSVNHGPKTRVVVEEPARKVVKKKRYVKRYMQPPRQQVVRERVVVRRAPPPTRVYEYRYYEPRSHRVVHERRYYEPRTYAPAPVSVQFGVGF